MFICCSSCCRLAVFLLFSRHLCFFFFFFFLFVSVVFFFFFFKQKTAYEIMPSLVGSEMCIRDRWSDSGNFVCIAHGLMRMGTIAHSGTGGIIFHHRIL